MSVTATRVGVHVHRFGSDYRERTCVRCGVKTTLPERQANRERAEGVNRHDFRCEDCKPVKYFG
jgi:hypothetical protein